MEHTSTEPHDDRRQRSRKATTRAKAPKLVDAATVKDRISKEADRAKNVIANCQVIANAKDAYEAGRIPNWWPERTWADYTQTACGCSPNGGAVRLRVKIGSTISAHEATQSDLSYSHLGVISRHLDRAERAVFFGHGRKVYAAGAEPVGYRIFDDLSSHALTLSPGEERLAYLRRELGVSSEECQIPEPEEKARPQGKKKPSLRDQFHIAGFRLQMQRLTRAMDREKDKDKSEQQKIKEAVDVLRDLLAAAENKLTQVAAAEATAAAATDTAAPPSPSATAAADDAPALPPPVRRPYLLSDDDDAIPVHYPGFALSGFELLTSEIVVTTAELTRMAQLILKTRTAPGYAVDDLLALRTSRASYRFINDTEFIRPLIADTAADGKRWLEDPDDPQPLPLYTGFAAALPEGFHPVAWVPVIVRDPLDDPQPTSMEVRVWRLLGLLDALDGRMLRWGRERQAGAVADSTLIYQLDQALARARTELTRVRCEFLECAQRGVQQEEQYGCTEARLDVPLLARPSDPNLIIAGADAPVPCYVKLAEDAQHRHLALSLFTSQLVLSLGGRGWGKSHVGRAIAEALHLHLPGISRVPGPLRSVTFEIDHNLGPGRRQMLRGLFPNDNAEQLAKLHALFGTRVSNAAFRHAILRCLPASVDKLKRELAAYVERGLIILPIEIGPQNLTQLALEALLGSAFSRGPDRPAYADYLASIIGNGGGKLTVAALIDIIDAAPEFAQVRGRLIAQLLPMLDLVRPGADVRDDLKEQCPVFYLLECEHQAESFLLGLMVALMHGIARPTGRPEDETMLWIFCDELSKLMKLPVVGHLLLAMAKELRHRMVSLYLAGQSATGLPPDFLGLVSVFFLFHLASRADFTPLKELEYFRDVSYDQVRRLELGQALVGAVNCTDRRLRDMAQWMALRPTLIDAGGESLTTR